MTSNERSAITDALSKVPAVTLGFWIIKIFATTLGETAGDSVTMTWLGETTANPMGAAHIGYLIGTGILIVPLILLVAAQIRARAFHPLLYWATIIASTTAGTTLADFCTRFLGEGTNASYALGSAILLACVLATLATWRAVMGTVAVESVREPKAEMFYWTTITFSQTLGTALGDWTADSSIMGHQIGFTGGALIFGAALAVVALVHFRTALSRAALFWAAFILTRPLGATVGDFLDKPHAKGGLDFSRPIASLALLVAIGLCLWWFPQRPAEADAGH
ncbi:hypothetical protein [Novosphingobium sp.]|uniref:COG4705 family protein n=1 Tax=Novosphingobium sp. TaxID=1874826 RepID=UPI0025DD68A4|nr:hypothetical protein [Novosphingobium sp.]